MVIKEDVIWLIANNEFLTEKHFKEFDFTNAYIIHFNNALHIEYFKSYTNTLVLNNFTGWGGGFHGMNRLFTIINNFENIYLSLQSHQVDKEVYIEKKNLIDKTKISEILLSDEAWKSFKVGCTPSIGYIILFTLLQLYPHKTINLIGFTGGYTINNKTYGYGHTWKDEQAFINACSVNSYHNNIQLL